MKRLLLFTFVIASAYAESLSTTTTTGAVSASNPSIQLASTAGAAAGYELYIDREAMRIVSITADTVTVKRGQEGTAATPHASGANVWVGPTRFFADGDLSGGGCTNKAAVGEQLLSIRTGNVWQCGTNGSWSQSSTAPGPVIKDASGNVTIGGDVTVGGKVYATGGVGGDLTVQGDLSVATLVARSNGLPTPAVPTLATVGTAGSTTYKYKIAWHVPAGDSAASDEVEIATGNATLDGTNYITITPPACPDVPNISVDVFLSTASESISDTGILGNTACGVAYHHTGQLPDGLGLGGNGDYIQAPDSDSTRGVVELPKVVLGGDAGSRCYGAVCAVGSLALVRANGGPVMHFMASGGTTTSPTATTDGFYLMSLVDYGFDGVEYPIAARIDVRQVGEALAGGGVASQMSFTTTDDTGAGHANLTIGSDGKLAVRTLAGTGNAFACIDADGKLYRSATACN